EQGARVVVNDLGCSKDGAGSDPTVAAQVVDEIRGRGGEAIANVDTVATAAGAAGIVRAAVELWGGVDVLVNNAGILQDKSLLGLSESMWDEVMAVPLRGAFLCTPAAAAQLLHLRRCVSYIHTPRVSVL